MIISDKFTAEVAKRNAKYARDVISRCIIEPPSQTPTEWCVENLELKTTTIKGRFSLRGREYLREPIDEIADDDLHFQTCCWGTGCAKTVRNISQVVWVMANDPSAIIWALPVTEGPGGAREFNNSALIPTIKATECFRDKIPTGASRHDFAGLKCIFGGNTLHLAGANSPGQLAGPRRRIAISDENDKFPEQIAREASADYLLNERTKQVPRSKMFRGSSPTKEGFGIWPHLMSSDLRRRFLLCPSCRDARRFVLAQSQQFTVLPVKFANGDQIFLSEMRWDKEAKRKDGSWDIDRVIRSTRFECPFCGFHMRDHHREQLDAGGIWTPTREAVGHHGYHLPSFYAPHVDFESSWGGMAKKFLDAQDNGKIGGYVNSELAEVHASQEHATIEVASGSFAMEDWTAVLSVDFQKLWPFLWFIVQKWSSFKLHPQFPMSVEGKPLFLEKLNIVIRAQCEAVVNSHLPAWFPVAEILRFDPRTGQFPILEFLVAQKLTGARLVAAWEQCGKSTMDFGRYLYREMGQRMPKGGDSEIIAAGHCDLSGDDAWAELREMQQQYNVGGSLKKFGLHPNRAVVIDSGYAEEHNPEVLRKCFESGFNGRWKFFDPINKKFQPNKTHQHCRPVPIDCWIPYKGYPIKKRWRVAGVEREFHWQPDDPFKGLSEADKYTIEILEAASELYFHRWHDSIDRQKKIRLAIAENKHYRGNVWNVSDNLVLHGSQMKTRDDFNRQLAAKGRNADGEIWERGTGGSGKRRHPDHLNDCCRNAYPLAEALGFFSYETQEKK